MEKNWKMENYNFIVNFQRHLVIIFALYKGFILCRDRQHKMCSKYSLRKEIFKSSVLIERNIFLVRKSFC